MTPTVKTKAVKVGWNAIVMLIVAIVGMGISNNDRLFGKGVKSGTLLAKVDGNGKEIARIDTKGSAIVQDLKIELTEVRGKVSRNEADLIEIKKTTQKQYETIIELLTR